MIYKGLEIWEKLMWKYGKTATSDSTHDPIYENKFTPPILISKQPKKAMNIILWIEIIGNPYIFIWIEYLILLFTSIILYLLFIIYKV